MTKRMKKDTEWTVRAVLPDYVTQDPKLQKVVVGIVAEKRRITSVVSAFSRILPLPEKFRFLKRVKTIDNEKPLILVSCEKSLDDVEKQLSSFKDELVQAGLEFPLRQHEIFCQPPLTRSHFEIVKKVWPCHFHEDKNLESLIHQTRPDIWKEKEFKFKIDTIEKVMDLAKGSMGSAAIVVDPKTREIKSISTDTRSEHPLRHGVMNVIDAVAHAQGGGAWPG